MANLNEDLKGWHDWTNPDFFQGSPKRKQRIVPLFLRQLLPVRFQKTRLTLIGWMLIVVALGIGSAAYNTSSNILFMTLSLLLSSLVLSGLLSLINFRKLQWEMCTPQHLQVGEVGMAEVDVTNQKSIFPTMSICFTVGSSASTTDEKLYLKQVLSAGASTKLEWTFVPVKRGRCEVFLSGVESQFPFGFLRKVMGRKIKESVLVWPQSIEYAYSPDSNGHRYLSGQSRRKAGLGSDLLNLRPYAAGDPPRLVHWKATARMGKLMIRQLAQEGESGFHIRLDTDRTVWDDRQIETLCSLACSLAGDLFTAGRLESLTVNGQHPMVVRSLRELHDFFDVLALVQRTPTASKESNYRPKNLITFRPLGERDVAIYVDEEKAGQTNC